LPTRFGIDKRRAHLSALINAGQLSRDAALAELRRPLYEPALLGTDKLYVAKKWGMAVEELDRLLCEEGRSHLDFPSDETWIRPLLSLKASGRHLVGLIRRGVLNARSC
jgi:hypothetical protein